MASTHTGPTDEQHEQPNALVQVECPQVPCGTSGEVDVLELVQAFLSGRSKQTIRAYTSDLEDFAGFIEALTVAEAARELLGAGHGRANLLAFRFKAHLSDERELAPTTVNRKLASLRSLVALGNTMGMIDWQLQVQNMRIDRKGTVTGIGLGSVRSLLGVATGEKGAKAARDRAIVRVFFDLALRRNEVCSLDLDDVDLAGHRILVIRKGHTQKTVLTLPAPTSAAVAEWVERRGTEPGPLFVSLDHRYLGQMRRLTTCGIYHVIRRLGEKAGFKVHPHQLRHDSITEAVKSAQTSGIGLEEVMDFSGHRQIETLLIYRDRERNVQGQLASQVAAKL